MAWKKKPGQSTEEYYRQFAKEIIGQIERGTAPWQKQWKPGESHMPENFSTGQAYRGGNAIHLMVKGAEKAHNDNRWGTYNQIKEEGGQVRKGEKGVSILVYKPPTVVHQEKSPESRGREDTEQAETKTRPMWKRFTVFNVEQADGLKLEKQPAATPEWKAQENVEKVIEESGVRIRNVNGDRAFYNMGKDEIVLPEKGQFVQSTHYYQTALHELGHSTGHRDRMDRESLQAGVKHGFGSEQYAREELRAEISAMMSGDRLGTGHEPQHGAAYVQVWVSALKNDPMEIHRAASEASRISDYVCEGRGRERMAAVHQERGGAIKSPGEARQPKPERVPGAGPSQPERQPERVIPAKAPAMEWSR